MKIVEYSSCCVCGKSYRGEFLLDIEGNVRCVDCENPSIVNVDVTWEATSENDEERIYTRVTEMLLKDLDYLYPMYEVGHASSIDQFYKDGEIDSYKLYFMGNPMELAEAAHKATYACLEYLDTENKDFVEFAELVVATYRELRERLFSDEDIEAFWNLLASEEMHRIEVGEYDSGEG